MPHIESIEIEPKKGAKNKTKTAQIAKPIITICQPRNTIILKYQDRNVQSSTRLGLKISTIITRIRAEQFKIQITSTPHTQTDKTERLMHTHNLHTLSIPLENGLPR